MLRDHTVHCIQPRELQPGRHKAYFWGAVHRINMGGKNC